MNVYARNWQHNCSPSCEVVTNTRHDGLIPWDDDLDIIIFDTDKFKKTCRLQLEAKGYIVYDDMRTFEGVEKRCGYRIHSEEGLVIPGQTWKFSQLGVSEPVIINNDGDNIMTLPPEEFSYAFDDFLPV